MLLTITKRFVVLLLLAGPAVAQRYEPPPPPLTTAPCKPTKKEPCPDPVKANPPSANPFPFPGEAPDSSSVKADSSPETPKSQSTTPASPGAFPFPTETTPDMPGTEPASSASSGSSSSSSDTDSSNRNPDEPALKDEGSAGSTRFSRRKLPKVEDMGAREIKDVEVANYYLSTGNLQAAYLRAKDAIEIDTADPAAHFALAQAAQRLNKPAEARVEYQATLQNDPTDKQIKEATRALAELVVKVK